MMSQSWVESIVIEDDDDYLDQSKKSSYSKLKQYTDLDIDIDVDIETKGNNIETKDIKIKGKNIEPKVKKVRKVKELHLLKTHHSYNLHTLEIGIDEAGRGPMFGPVYAGAVILPSDTTLFDHSLMKDSKKFTSKKKIEEVAEYIKANAIAWAVAYEDEQVIDNINILQATQSAMHKAIREIYNKLNLLPNFKSEDTLLLVDGNYFKPFTVYNKKLGKLESINSITVTGGDNTYSCIAAASILAKVERDKYIDGLCSENPELELHYGIASNKGYGAKRHIDGIKQYGITKWHRRTFGICKQFC